MLVGGNHINALVNLCFSHATDNIINNLNNQFIAQGLFVLLVEQNNHFEDISFFIIDLETI